MIVLKEFKFLQRIMGLNSQGGFASIIPRLLYLIIFTSSTMMYTTFFILNVHGNTSEAMSLLSAVVGSTMHYINYVHMLIGRRRFHSLLDDLQTVVIERQKRVEVEAIYIKAGQQTGVAAKIIIYVLLGILVLPLYPFVLAAIDWCLGKYTMDSWILINSVGTPFELNTTLRCASVVLYQALFTKCCLIVVSSVPILLIGFMNYSKACFVDIKTLFVQVNHLSKPRSHQKSNRKQSSSNIPANKSSERSTPSQRIKLELRMRELCKEAVVLHQKVNRLLGGLADVMNVIMFVTVTFQTVCICGCLLVIAKYQMAVVTTVMSLNVLYIFFYMSQKYNTNSTDLSYAIYQAEWYQYPRSVQLFVLHMMMRSQQPFHLNAYGILELNLENFLGLLNRIFSAFMVLRSMD